MKYMNDIIPVCNNAVTTVGEVEILAKIISVGVAVLVAPVLYNKYYKKDWLYRHVKKSGDVQ